LIQIRTRAGGTVTMRTSWCSAEPPEAREGR